MNARDRDQKAEVGGRKPEGVGQKSEVRPLTSDFRRLIASFGFVVCAVMIFARLGHYPLWDDETMIALVAKGVLRTGDTSVVLEHNVVAYNSGVLLRDLHDRSTPPLSAYLAAISIGLLGDSAFAARLPFALFGLATMGLILWWAWRDRAPPLMLWLIVLGCIGKVSLILFLRQCRYYGPAVFFTVAIVYLYLHWAGNRRQLWLMTVCSVFLFAANYLNWFALYVCLALDYFLWRRKERPLRGADPSFVVLLRRADWLVLLVPQLVLCGAIASVWNPLRTEFGGFVARNDLADRLKLFWWNWRDLNDSEFFAGALILAAPVIGFILWRAGKKAGKWESGQRGRGAGEKRVTRASPGNSHLPTSPPAHFLPGWLLRGSLALAVYVSFVTVVSPQVVKETVAADVRYFVPLIPLCLAIEVLVLWVIARKQAWLAVAVAVLVFGTNLLNGGPLGWLGKVRSAFVGYVGELARPVPDPYSAAIRWVNEHVGEDESVFVSPYYMAYPLMFHAPKAIYAWQLKPEQREQFPQLEAIHFAGVKSPDYIIAFGPEVADVIKLMESGRVPDFRYERVAVLSVYWRCFYRPELIWHSFKPETRFKPETHGISIFRHERKAEAERGDTGR